MTRPHVNLSHFHVQQCFILRCITHGVFHASLCWSTMTTLYLPILQFCQIAIVHISTIVRHYSKPKQLNNTLSLQRQGRSLPQHNCVAHNTTSVLPEVLHSTLATHFKQVKKKNLMLAPSPTPIRNTEDYEEILPVPSREEQQLKLTKSIFPRWCHQCREVKCCLWQNRGIILWFWPSYCQSQKCKIICNTFKL